MYTSLFDAWTDLGAYLGYPVGGGEGQVICSPKNLRKQERQI